MTIEFSFSLVFVKFFFLKSVIIVLCLEISVSFSFNSWLFVVFSVAHTFLHVVVVFVEFCGVWGNERDVVGGVGKDRCWDESDMLEF